MKLHIKILVLFFALSLTYGCTAVSKWTNYQAACASDPVCLEKAKSYAKVGEAVASPWGGAAAAGAGACVMYIALGVLGSRKKKE